MLPLPKPACPGIQFRDSPHHIGDDADADGARCDVVFDLNSLLSAKSAKSIDIARAGRQPEACQNGKIRSCAIWEPEFGFVVKDANGRRRF